MAIKSGIFKECITCGKQFYVVRSRIDEKKFCSKDCYVKDMPGRKLSPYAKDVAIKTLAIWGKKRVENMPRGSGHVLWKGEDAGYRAAHYWIRRRKGKPKVCSICGKSSGRLHWANIDHTYRRVDEDYFEACPSCHKFYDRKMK